MNKDKQHDYINMKKDDLFYLHALYLLDVAKSYATRYINVIFILLKYNIIIIKLI